MQRILFVVLSLFCLNSHAQTTRTVPEDFVEIAPLFSGHASDIDNFSVQVVDNKLEVTKGRCNLKIENGILIGTDNGEWGGELLFRPADTTKKPIKIKDGNTQFIFTHENKIYFIQGLNHMTSVYGALFELEATGDRFTYHEVTNFTDEHPILYTTYQDKIFVVTKGYIEIEATKESEYAFNETLKLYQIHNAKKQHLYEFGIELSKKYFKFAPNSIAVVDDDNIFLGERGGIVKLDIANKTVKFYRPAE
ncbi:hypothetical protein AGMMS50289_09750 [Betaproteobacteria bacterium]|nr:hypothetical protein AGMMS50289_09750 [Betaproteobacteria bacterium]